MIQQFARSMYKQQHCNLAGNQAGSSRAPNPFVQLATIARSQASKLLACEKGTMRQALPPDLIRIGSPASLYHDWLQTVAHLSASRQTVYRLVVPVSEFKLGSTLL